MYGRRVFEALAILVGATFSFSSFVGTAMAQADPQTDRVWTAVDQPGLHRVEIVQPPFRVGGGDADEFALRVRVLPMVGSYHGEMRTSSFGEREISYIDSSELLFSIVARANADIRVGIWMRTGYHGEEYRTSWAELPASDWTSLDLPANPRGGWLQELAIWLEIDEFSAGDTVLVDLNILSLADKAYGGEWLIDEFGTAPVGIAGEAPIVARSTTLRQNMPNPFNPRTTIPFELTATGAVQLAVYDVAGRKVATLVDNFLPAGVHAVSWDGNDATGTSVPSGVYLARLEASGTQLTRRMLLVK